MHPKPENPYPRFVRSIARHLLPASIYRRTIGRHEDTSMRLWRLIAQRIPADSVVLDIGAFLGTYALAARQVNPLATIYAFEPDPVTVARMVSDCESAGISVQQHAVSDFHGESVFKCNSEQGTLVPSYNNASAMDNTAIVQVVTVDAFCVNKALHLALMKIDVEGGESAVLRGAKHSIVNYRPMILCEILDDQAGRDVMRLLPSDYLFLHIDENKGIEERTVITRDKWKNKNWLLAPIEKRDWLNKE